MGERRLKILFAAPAYWPAASFGGPIAVMRELASELTGRGHEVDVLTTSLTGVTQPGSARTRRDVVDGARVHYLATPLRFRWMGVTPSLPLWIRRLERPDVVHVFGYRDPLGTLAAAWCRVARVPYVFEALGMFRPKLRKVRLKRLLDHTVCRGVPEGARLLVAVSRIERQEYLDGGHDAARIALRPNGFPTPYVPRDPGRLRRRLGLAATDTIVLSVGRVARGKGLELLVEAMPTLPAGTHLVIAGPDDGHGMTAELLRRRQRLGLGSRVHLLGPVTASDVSELYGGADVCALVSAHESFGMVAAEAAATGAAVLVTDTCGVAECFDVSSGVVVPYAAAPIEEALRALLADGARRGALGAGARRLASSLSWQRAADLQERIYRDALASP